jgi:hypothetical protein
LSVDLEELEVHPGVGDWLSSIHNAHREAIVSDDEL